jgi:hypothetical protein
MSIRRLQARTGGKVRARRLQRLASAAALSLAVGLSGCADTPWGETLSGSFPTSPGPGPQEPEPAPEAAPATVETPNSPLPPSAAVSPPGGARTPVPGTSSPGSAGLGPSSQGSTAPSSSGLGAPASPSAAPGSKKPQGAPAGKPLATQAKPTPVSTAPSPYRVTIRLPQADPSAPAEGVTQALRSAGIPFEVETIERVKGAAASQPEGAQGTAAAPAVRPAPPPR